MSSSNVAVLDTSPSINLGLVIEYKDHTLRDISQNSMSNIGSTSEEPTEKGVTKRNRGRPVGDRASKKAELMSAAIAVTAEEGYSGASLRKVAKRMGATTGTVTYYFANKEEMLTAVAEELFIRFHKQLAFDTPHADINLVIEKLLTWDDSEQPGLWLAFLQLLTHARQEPAFAPVIQRHYAKIREALTFLVEKGQSNQIIRNDITADMLAEQLSALGDGWMMMMSIEPERFTPEKIQLLSDAVLTLIKPGQ